MATRRQFLAGAAAASCRAEGQQWIIDTHIHLFDPGRPEGIPWPPKDNPILYRPALPARFREVTRGLGVAGAIEVECSPWLEDNQWVLDVAAKDEIMVGTIGNLEPGKPEFSKQLDRFASNPLFRGIRCGYLWGRKLNEDRAKPEFIAGLKLLADRDLTMDAANVHVGLLEDVLRISDAVPGLRIVIDHLPRFEPPQDGEAGAKYATMMKELKQRPQVFAKVSGVLRRIGGRIPLDTESYRPRLDEIYSIFGPDRVVYGSDWPNSDPFGAYADALRVVREYFSAKGGDAAAKYFFANSQAAYKWVRRGTLKGA